MGDCEGTMSTGKVRTPRLVEAFEVQCHACDQPVEIAADVVHDGWCICPTPGCGQALLIRWAEKRACTR